MRRFLSVLTAGLTIVAATGFALPHAGEGPYHVLKTAKVGGEGGFDYVYADSDGRKLYVARSGPSARVSAYNLDTLEPAGEIPMVSGHGVAADTMTHHAFASSSPVAMWGSKTKALL